MTDAARSAPETGLVGLSPIIGWVCEWSRAASPVVDFPGSAAGPVEATTIVDPPAVIADKQPVLLVFDGGRSDSPVVVGVVRQPDSAEDDTSKVSVTADGSRIAIEGKDEVVLRCGRASITMRRNGRVVIEGDYVETRSKGTNRIKGGWVLIN